MKTCISCNRTLPDENFCKNKRYADGLNSKCKDCVKAYRLTISDKIKDGQKRYREENRDKINAWRRENYQKLKDDKKERYRELSSEMDSMKQACVKCGESRLYVIDFHHIDPKDKKFNVGHARTYSQQTLSEEISKCVCLCRNCHQEFHHFYGNTPERPEEALTEYLGRNPYEV